MSMQIMRQLWQTCDIVDESSNVKACKTKANDDVKNDIIIELVEQVQKRIISGEKIRLSEGFYYSIYKAYIHMSKQSKDDVVNRTATYLNSKLCDRITMYRTMVDIRNGKKVDNKKLQSIYYNVNQLKTIMQIFDNVGVDLLKLVYEGGKYRIDDSVMKIMKEQLKTDKPLSFISKFSLSENERYQSRRSGGIISTYEVEFYPLKEYMNKPKQTTESGISSGVLDQLNRLR